MPYIFKMNLIAMRFLRADAAYVIILNYTPFIFV